MEENKEFLKECKEVRNNFAKIAGQYTVSEHLKLRTEIDTLLIMYDQLCERVRVSGLHENIVNDSREIKSCAAGRDGECNHPQCPQKRDGEPKKTGRSCPLWDVHKEIYT
jgi:hypothetical protein